MNNVVFDFLIEFLQSAEYNYDEGIMSLEYSARNGILSWDARSVEELRELLRRALALEFDGTLLWEVENQITSALWQEDIKASIDPLFASNKWSVLDDQVVSINPDPTNPISILEVPNSPHISFAVATPRTINIPFLHRSIAVDDGSFSSTAALATMIVKLVIADIAWKELSQKEGLTYIQHLNNTGVEFSEGLKNQMIEIIEDYKTPPRLADI